MSITHAKPKKQHDRPKSGPKGEKRVVDTMPLYILIVIFFVAYLIVQGVSSLSMIIGAALFFLIIITITIEVLNGFKEEGYKKNILEIVIAIAAVVIIWFGMQFALGTPTPLDVVPSCSMLPALQRGDMIMLQGVNINNIRAPIVNVSQKGWNATFSNLNNVSLECVAYSSQANGYAHVSQLYAPGDNVGLIKVTPSGSSIVYNQTGLIRYNCGIANIKYSNGTVAQEVTTKSITIGNTTITGDKNNSIVVYGTIPQDEFYKLGDSYIVHRAYAIVNASGTYYVLTKGDNNPGLDIQYQNYPPTLGQVDGKEIASIPYLGYLKLILSNNFVEPTGCNFVTQN